VHESGHEWFGNNITTKDIADMWVHEGFTTYSEALYIECILNKDSASKYIRGLRRNIRGTERLIADYGVNKESGIDIYDKGANLIHMIRKIIDNDSLFREILRGLNYDFAKTTVTTKQIEDYIILKSGKNLAPVFDQYLRGINIPVFEYELAAGKLTYRWNKCSPTFNMPVKITVGEENLRLDPTVNKQTVNVSPKAKKIVVDPDFYINVKQGFK
jgi:aminopeptidase N